MKKIVAITGWDRSGSTIVAAALGSTRGAIAAGEITNVWERGYRRNAVCSCGQPFRDCSFWNPVTVRAFGSADGVGEAATAAMAGLGSGALLRPRRASGPRIPGSEAYAPFLSSIYEALAAESGATVIVDSSKKPWHTAVAADLEGFDVYVLHIVRDPRGVAYSFRKRVAYDDTEEMARHGATFSSLAWVYRNRLTEREWAAGPRYLRLRYEDFVADPRESLNAMYRWLGVEADPPVDDDDRLLLEPAHNVAGNPARFNRGPVPLRLDDAWRRELPRPVAAYVGALTAADRRRYGYS